VDRRGGDFSDYFILLTIRKASTRVYMDRKIVGDLLDFNRVNWGL